MRGVVEPKCVFEREIRIVVNDSTATAVVVGWVVEERARGENISRCERHYAGGPRPLRTSRDGARADCERAAQHVASAQRHFLSQVALLLELGGKRPQCKPASTINTSPVTTLAPSKNHTSASAICSAVGTTCNGTIAAALTRKS